MFLFSVSLNMDQAFHATEATDNEPDEYTGRRKRYST